ncbi:MAG: dynamin family protein [Thermoguttaceae bacterium]|jgi:hypothetical protein|nr:dynamin family protein [Thermoguttaceae bacterium]
MVRHILDYQEFYRLIEDFSGEAPRILRAHQTTADLMPQVSGLLDAMESGFTVAVVGQMRSGKSSLLNALIGADLAVTGVNETTATVNHFVYGEGEQCRRFRVFWKDRPAEDFPLDEIGRWVGDSERAKATRRIEFFADVEFLRTARVVDTPGTRSTIEFHGEATRDFLGLAEKLDETTRSQGSAADAIIYVLMPVARQADQELLGDFERNTRLPGSTPYNSVAVVHKWETLNAPSPLDEAHRKAGRIAAVMGDLVSSVIPVSAPLARAAESFPDAFWHWLLQLSSGCPGETIEELLLSERDFQQLEDPRCPVPPVARRELRRTYPLPWASLKAIVQLGHARRPGSAAELRSVIHQASNIATLRDTLQRRFFARSRMIKAFSLLAKALAPCEVAGIRLRNHKRRYTLLLNAAHDAIRQASALSAAAGPIEPIRRYLEETRSLVENDLRSAADALRRLDEAKVLLQDNFDDMQNDLRMLEYLEDLGGLLGEDWTRALKHLFGYAGPEIDARIGQLRDMAAVNDDLSAVQWAIGQIRQRWAGCGGELGRLMKHALFRLEQIADDREQQARRAD